MIKKKKMVVRPRWADDFQKVVNLEMGKHSIRVLILSKPETTQPSDLDLIWCRVEVIDKEVISVLISWKEINV